jgi:hypothetical protein
MKITIIDNDFTFLGNEVSNPKNSGGSSHSSVSHTLSNNHGQDNPGPGNPGKELQYTNIRKAIAKLFYNYKQGSSFYMTKTQQHENYGIYKARVSMDLLGNEKFIVAIVPNDNIPIGNIKFLESLRWVSFQTRETTNIKKEFNKIDIQPQSYVQTDVPLLNDKIHYEKTTKRVYVYVPENLPLKVEIIPLKEGDSYSDHGSVISALNIFSTVINLE